MLPFAMTAGSALVQRYPLAYLGPMPGLIMRTMSFAAMLLPLLAPCQPMTLTGGTLVIEGGTTVELTGPLIWEIAPGATLINNGRIELGHEAVIDEPLGSPITGDGTEHALYASTAPAVDHAPGGLGLSLTTSDALGDVEVTRGHTVQLDGTSTESIARWFELVASPLPGASVGLRFHYDPAELNGLAETALILHSGNELIGPWTALTGTPDLPNHDILSSWLSPWGFITAFDEDITTDVPGGTDPEFMIWPSVTEDVVHIRSRNGARVENLSVMDATGRLIEQLIVSQDGSTLSVAAYPPGVYLLSVNGTRAFRIVRP